MISTEQRKLRRWDLGRRARALGAVVALGAGDARPYPRQVPVRQQVSSVDNWAQGEAHTPPPNEEGRRSDDPRRVGHGQWHAVALKRRIQTRKGPVEKWAKVRGEDDRAGSFRLADRLSLWRILPFSVF
jgi:hypothetical protein